MKTKNALKSKLVEEKCVKTFEKLFNNLTAQTTIFLLETIMSN